jgi:hypothetical protein
MSVERVMEMELTPGISFRVLLTDSAIASGIHGLK